MNLLIAFMSLEVPTQGLLICLTVYKATQAVVAPGEEGRQKGLYAETSMASPFYPMGACRTPSLTEQT